MKFADRGHKPRIGFRIDRRAGCSWRDVTEHSQGLFYRGARDAAGYEDDARGAFGVRPRGQRQRLMHDALYCVHRDRLAFDVEDAFDAQQVAPFQPGQQIESQHEARARDRFRVTDRKTLHVAGMRDKTAARER